MVDAKTTILRRTWRTTLSVYKNSRVRWQSLEPGDLRLGQEKPAQWPDPRMLSQILEQQRMWDKITENNSPSFLTLTCGHDTPGDSHRRQIQPWTNLLYKEAARELCSDIWPRSLLRLLYLRHFRRHTHTRKRRWYRSRTVYQSNGDHFGGLQREHFLYTDFSPLSV